MKKLWVYEMTCPDCGTTRTATFRSEDEPRYVICKRCHVCHFYTPHTYVLVRTAESRVRVEIEEKHDDER